VCAEVLNVLDLFSGIGGMSLGLESTGGFRTVAFCEIEPFPRAVLAYHWPGVPIHDDVQSLSASSLRERVDVIAGGFPCQDISLAGKGAGLAGERSGLWFEYAKAIETLRPRYVLIENVSALRSRGLDQVLGSLAALGYDAEWHCIPACAVGAPHRRDRVWIVADAERMRKLQPQGSQCHEWRRLSDCSWWNIEPELGRVAHGIPNRVDRLRGLGNAIVPQIAEWIGRQIMKVAT